MPYWCTRFTFWKQRTDVKPSASLCRTSTPSNTEVIVLLCTFVHKWSISGFLHAERATNESGQFPEKGMPGLQPASLCITGTHYLTTSRAPELGGLENRYKRHQLQRLCGNCGWKSFQICQQRRTAAKANQWGAHEIEDNRIAALKENLEHSHAGRDKPS